MSVEVQECKSRWGLECPRRWARMLGTDDERVRVCGTCGREVRLCLSLHESGDWVRQGPRFGIACAPEHLVEDVAITFIPERYWHEQQSAGPTCKCKSPR